MKRVLFVFIHLCFVSAAAFSQTTDLIISEYIEGASNDKCIEIYNGTGAAVNLTGYSIKIYSNGNSTPSSTINLSGTLNNNSVYVVCNSSAQAALLSVADQTSGSLTFNGDDAVALFNGVSMIDLIGNIGCDPGLEWTELGNGTADNIIYRQSGYCTGVTTDPANTPCSFPTFTSANWVSLNSTSNFSNLGTHTASCSSCTPPTTQASSITISAITSNSMTINWTRGDGNAVLVVVKEGSAVDSDPVNGTTYTANSVFGSGSQIGAGNYVVYDGIGTSVNITGLNPNVTYYVAVYEYNTTGTCYLKPGATGNATTLCAYPTTPASNISFSSVTTNSFTISWTNGDGAGRIVLIKAGSAVDAVPSDGVSYTANSTFGSGSQIGTGNYVVYSGTGNSVTVTGLTDNTMYYVEIFEYNGTCYLTSSTLTGSQFTVSAQTDIVAVASSEAATIPSTENTPGPLTATQGVQVWQFTVREGGATGDIDNLATTVQAITVTQGTGNAINSWVNAIQSVDLFDGTTHLAQGTVLAGSNKIVFSGLSYTVADDAQKTLSIHLSLNCPFTNGSDGNNDGDDFQFQISQANVSESASGSQFAAFTAQTSANGQNVVSVTADRLQFQQQPTTTGVNNIMTPAVTVKATDACGNTDLDISGTVTISSSGSLDGASTTTATFSSGVATFSNLIHDATGTGLTLTASSPGLTSATSNNFDIVLTTTFEPGDFAIVAINTKRVDISTVSADEMCFVTFKDITPATEFEITDNGYERLYAGKWGNTEGTIRFKRTGSTVPAGTVICLEGPNDSLYNDADMNYFDIYVCGVKDDANWSIQNLSSYYPISQFDLNVNDQVWFMQGGSWTDGTTSSSYDALYSGNMMYGWTATPWKTAPGYNSTKGSTLYPRMECVSTDVSVLTNGDKVKYTGPKTATNKYGWIQRINNAANWTDYADNASYDAEPSPYDYMTGTCPTTNFPLTTVTVIDGMWTGNSDNNWFNCNNWGTLVVPDNTVNVTISPTAANAPVIDAAAANSDLYSDIAQCNNITISNTSLTIEASPLNRLDVYGNLNITSGGSLDMDDGNSATADGTINLYGNWNNQLSETAFLEGNGTVNFIGSATQTVSLATGTQENFANVSINNSATGSAVMLNTDMNISGNITLTDGIVNTNGNKLIISNTATTSLNGGSNASFVYGTLRRYIALPPNTDTYFYPVGNGTATTNFHNLALLNNNLAGVTYIDGSVGAVTETGANVDANLNTTQNGTPIINARAETAEWDLTPDASPSGGSYGVRLYIANISGLTDNQFCPIKRSSVSTSYADWQTFDATTTIPAAGTAGRTVASGYAERTGYTSFSKFTVGASSVPLPVELLDFSAMLQENKVLISWITQTEINNDYFTVLKSKDGKNFYEIEKVNGSGTTNESKNYFVYDDDIQPGVVYYQLKQTDYDGSSVYSNVIALEIYNKENDLEIINLTTANDKIQVRFANNKTATLRVVNMLGQVVYEKRFTPSSSNEAEIQLPSQVYFIQLTDGNNVINTKTKL